MFAVVLILLAGVIDDSGTEGQTAKRRDMGPDQTFVNEFRLTNLGSRFVGNRVMVPARRMLTSFAFQLSSPIGRHFDKCHNINSDKF